MILDLGLSGKTGSYREFVLGFVSLLDQWFELEWVGHSKFWLLIRLAEGILSPVPRISHVEITLKLVLLAVGDLVFNL